MKLIDIAAELKLPPGTVRRWKSIYDWECERSEMNSERSEMNSERSEMNSDSAVLYLPLLSVSLFLLYPDFSL